MSRKRLIFDDEELDPMSGVSNLFDVAMVFVVALMVALILRFNIREMFFEQDFTMIKNPGQNNMEIIVKKGEKIESYKPSNTNEGVGNKGKRVGVAYQLESGDIIYVPE
ncbi:MAG: DUF2149 domain-containing protein [Bacteroidales bacterium]|nr:DUF2149 domain-containing protein [Bacteroidales bacterium]